MHHKIVKKMKQIITSNAALLEVLESHGINIECDRQMRMVISDKHADAIPDIIAECAPAAFMDYIIKDID